MRERERVETNIPVFGIQNEKKNSEIEYSMPGRNEEFWEKETGREKNRKNENRYFYSWKTIEKFP